MPPGGISWPGVRWLSAPRHTQDVSMWWVRPVARRRRQLRVRAVMPVSRTRPRMPKPSGRSPGRTQGSLPHDRHYRLQGARQCLDAAAARARVTELVALTRVPAAKQRAPARWLLSTI